MKTNSLLTALCASALFAGTLGAAGCGRPDAGTGGLYPMRAPLSMPAEETRSAGQSAPATDDASITANVEKRLEKHANWLPSVHVEVSTEEGVVKLSGYGPPQEIAHAELLAQSVYGVRHVDNQLRPTTTS
jgi:hypothetical protein